MKRKISICGGGNLSHALAGLLGKNDFIQVNVLTRHPIGWLNKIELFDFHNQFYGQGYLHQISTNPAIVKNSDYIIVTQPCFAREALLHQIKPYVDDNTVIVVMPGWGGSDRIVKNELGEGIKIISCKRVPCICRIKKYGSSCYVDLKPSMQVFHNEHTSYEDINRLQKLLGVTIELLKSFWTINLSNSNPVIHIARICELVKQQPYENPVYFYRDWKNEASELALKMDEELYNVLDLLNALEDYTNLKTHYGVNSPEMLTKKINSIDSFHNILAPMITHNGKWEFDFSSRYITEDLFYGTLLIKLLATKNNIQTPYIDSVFYILQPYLEKEIVLPNGSLVQHSCDHLPF